MMARTDESQYVLTATYERACESHLWTGSVRKGNWEMTAVAVQQSDFLRHVLQCDIRASSRIHHPSLYWRKCERRLDD
jgi:hypothetical protein